MSSHSGGPSATPSESASSISALGWSDRWRALLAGAETNAGRPGRVLRHDGVSVLVGTEAGSSRAGLRPSTPPLAVGDWIVVDDSSVLELLPRSSLLQRRDPSTGNAQLIAANVDVVGVVCGLDRPVRLGLLQRFSALAWEAGAAPLLLLSKADLVDHAGATEDEIITSIPGSEVLSVSSTEAIGIVELLKRCAGRTLVLVGESGAGKSTLLNALAGRVVAETGEVRGGDHKGRHTTTSRELHVLDGDCCLIDTPGVREVGLFTDVDTIDEGFADIAELAGVCRFGDCDHDSEPGCAVLAAISRGELKQERLRSWRELRREAAAAEIRADPAARHRADRSQARVYREAQRSKRRNR